MATVGEACKKAEEENGHFADEKLALVIELGALKDDFAVFGDKAAADREAMEAALDSSGDTLFNYSYDWLCFHVQHMWEQASNPGRNAESFYSTDYRVLR